MNDLRRRFGLLVAAHRRQRGLTQEALAAGAGISVDMVSQIEGGRSGARFPTIEKLSAVLEVDPAELFTTEVPAGALERRELSDLSARLAGLSDSELRWLSGLIEAALKPRGR